jgi:hypothetical protein
METDETAPILQRPGSVVKEPVLEPGSEGW